MNAYDRVRLTRILDAAGHPGDEILDVLKRAGIDITVRYERTRTHCVNEVSL